MIPLFLIVEGRIAVDTYPGLILPGLNCAFTTLLLVSFFQTIPDDLIDAAKIDDCKLLPDLPEGDAAQRAHGDRYRLAFAFLTHWRSYMWP